MEEKHCIIGCNIDILNRTYKAQIVTEKINKMDFIKIKNFQY